MAGDCLLGPCLSGTLPIFDVDTPAGRESVRVQVLSVVRTSQLALPLALGAGILPIRSKPSLLGSAKTVAASESGIFVRKSLPRTIP
jgi:hypothetical protein